MNKFSDLLTNFLDARYWATYNLNDPKVKETMEYHKKALDDYMSDIETKARNGNISYSIHDLRMGGGS